MYGRSRIVILYDGIISLSGFLILFLQCQSALQSWLFGHRSQVYACYHLASVRNGSAVLNGTRIDNDIAVSQGTIASE
jgi:hypothetical protein